MCRRLPTRSSYDPDIGRSLYKLPTTPAIRIWNPVLLKYNLLKTMLSNVRNVKCGDNINFDNKSSIGDWHFTQCDRRSRTESITIMLDHSVN